METSNCWFLAHSTQKDRVSFCHLLHLLSIHPSSVNFLHFNHLLWNYLANLNQLWCLEWSLQKFFISFWSDKKIMATTVIHVSNWPIYQRNLLKPLCQSETNIIGMMFGRSSTNTPQFIKTWLLNAIVVSNCNF